MKIKSASPMKKHQGPFVSKVKLDPSQVQDRRGKQPHPLPGRRLPKGTL